MLAAMNDEELVAMIVVMLTGIVVTASSLWYKHRKARLELISKALDSSQLDAESRRMLVEELRGDSHWRQNLIAQARLVSRNIVFVIGWVTMFVGIGLMASGAWELFDAGVISAAAGFGIATVPLALRELHGRAAG